MEVAEKVDSDHPRPHLNQDDQQPSVHSAPYTIRDKIFNYFKIVDTRGAIPELDGLRAIAILLVLARHGVTPFYTPQDGLFSLGGAWDFAIPLLNGWAGVDLFFVLSGFLITYHLIRRWPTPFNGTFLFRYWLKRSCRIIPAYYAMLFIAAFGLIPYYVPPTSNMAVDIPIHLMFMQDYLGSEIVVVFWSLGVEEKFYLVAPFILLLIQCFQKPGLKYLALALLALLPLCLRFLSYQLNPYILTYTDFFWTLRAPFHLILDGFWMGTICAFLYHDQPKFLAQHVKFSKYLLLIGTTIIFSLLFPRPLLSSHDWTYGIITLSLIPLGFSAILLATIFHPNLVRFLSGHQLACLSKLSYSLYLIHITLIPLTIEWLNRISQFDTYPPHTQFMLFFPLYILLSILGALILHFGIEKPFLLVKDRIRM